MPRLLRAGLRESSYRFWLSGLLIALIVHFSAKPALSQADYSEIDHVTELGDAFYICDVQNIPLLIDLTLAVFDDRSHKYPYDRFPGSQGKRDSFAETYREIVRYITFFKESEYPAASAVLKANRFVLGKRIYSVYRIVCDGCDVVNLYGLLIETPSHEDKEDLKHWASTAPLTNLGSMKILDAGPDKMDLSCEPHWHDFSVP